MFPSGKLGFPLLITTVWWRLFERFALDGKPLCSRVESFLGKNPLNAGSLYLELIKVHTYGLKAILMFVVNG